MYGDNLYAPVAPNSVQESLGAGALKSEFDPLYDGDVNIEENALEAHDANYQEATTNDNGDLQAALFDDTDNIILSRRQITDTNYNSKVAGLNDSLCDAFDHVVRYSHARHHHAFCLPVEHGNLTKYTKLSAEKLHQLRLLCKDVHTIIIDEISMVSYEILGYIHQGLIEIKGTDDTEEYFGGLNIIAVGDFYQLPPVRDRFVFQNGRGYVPASMHLLTD